MKKIILKSFILMIAIFLSVLLVVPAMMYADPIPITAIDSKSGKHQVGVVLTAGA